MILMSNSNIYWIIKDPIINFDAFTIISFVL